MSNRREFIVQLSLGSGALASGTALAAAPALDENDATAKALGYVADTAKADAKKFPKHVAAQQCSNCTLFQGKAGEASGPCPIFAGKQVAAKGWCNSYVKKP
jgi:hypothetical protein